MVLVCPLVRDPFLLPRLQLVTLPLLEVWAQLRQRLRLHQLPAGAQA